MTQPSRDLEPAHSARDLYGVELRRQRRLLGLSLDRMSDIVNYSKTHLHGVETGERLPLPPLSEKLDVAFGTDGLFQGLWGAVKREYTPRRFDHCLELEARAVRIQAFGASIIPGLLQTAAYMRELFVRAEPEGARRKSTVWWRPAWAAKRSCGAPAHRTSGGSWVRQPCGRP
jgi:hypothetical protein